MFGINSLVAIFLLGSHGSRAHVVPANRISAASLSPRDGSLSTSSTSQIPVLQFMSSWENLSQSFYQCQSAFAQHSSIEVATQSIQKLSLSYEKAVEQYNSCEVCATSLSHSNFESQIKQSLAFMFSSFNSIMNIAQQKFGPKWSTHFGSAFQAMSQFSSFSKKVCFSAGIDFSSALSHLSIDQGLFNQVGINVDGTFARNGAGSFDNISDECTHGGPCDDSHDQGGCIYGGPCDDDHDQGFTGSLRPGLI